MMLFDEIIQLMIGLKDDQLKKIKDFILILPKTKHMWLTFVLSAKVSILSGMEQKMASRDSNVKIAVKFLRTLQKP